MPEPEDQQPPAEGELPRRNALRVGARGGVIGCSGCLVFIVIGLAVLAVGVFIFFKSIENNSTSAAPVLTAPAPASTPPAGVAEPEIATVPDPTGGRTFTCRVAGLGGNIHVVAFGPYALDTCNLVLGAPPPEGGPWALLSSTEGPPPGISSPEPDPGFSEACDLTAVDAATVLVEHTDEPGIAEAVCSYLVDQGLEDFTP